METSRQITLERNDLAQTLFGEHNRNLKKIEELGCVGIRARGNVIDILGPERGVVKVEKLVRELYRLLKSGYNLKESDIEGAFRLVSGDPSVNLDKLYKKGLSFNGANKPVVPKSVAQRNYMEAAQSNDIVFAIGPAGTGKTYLAMAMAVSALGCGQVSRIVLTRPAVEAGEHLGFLPGSLVEKVSPYLRPLYDALYDMMDIERVGALIERGIIEVAPLAFMRGRSLNNSFVILDEAQNTTVSQMKMFLTRIGNGSRTIINGDVTQVDLPAGKTSGLRHAARVLSDIQDIGFIEFSEKDVVRHPLVMKIIRAYEKEEQACLNGPGHEVLNGKE